MSDFYVIGVGRSGTMTVASTLCRDRNVCCFHEPSQAADGKSMVLAVDGHPQDDYLRDVRDPFVRSFADQWDFTHGRTSTVRGEVNSFLRYHVDEIRRVHPKATIAHLVRNPLKVVRSIYARKTYEPQMRGYRQLRIPGVSGWDSLDRFSKICWFWAHGDRAARVGADYSAKLEDIVSSHEAWRRFARPLGCRLSWRKWKASLTIKRNHTKAFRDLPDGWRETFDRICGEEMLASGYGQEGSS